MEFTHTIANRSASRVATGEGITLVGSHLSSRGKGTVSAFDTATGTFLYGLHPDELAEGDRFGQSIAIGEGLAVVGAVYHRTQPPGYGAAFVFDLKTGEQTAKLLPDEFNDNGGFGSSVAIRDGYILVGAHNGLRTKGVNGAAYLFDAASGDQLHEFRPPDVELLPEYGLDVALGGGYAFVAAPAYRTSTSSPVGAVFQYDILTGDLVRTLRAATSFPSSGFGSSIDTDGGRIAIGAAYDDTQKLNAGAVYIFDIETGGLISQLLATDGDVRGYLGAFVSISGERVLAYGQRDLRPDGPFLGLLFAFDAVSGNPLFEASGESFGGSWRVREAFEIEGDSVFAATSRGVLSFAIVPEPCTAGLIAQLLYFGLVPRRAP